MTQRDMVRVLLGDAADIALSAIALGAFLVGLGLWAAAIAGV